MHDLEGIRRYLHSVHTPDQELIAQLRYVDRMREDSPNSQYTDEPLIDAKEVALWLKVSEDWVWDHSTRRAPFLPAIWLSSGALKFRRTAIRAFFAGRERVSSLRQKQRRQSVNSPVQVSLGAPTPDDSPDSQETDDPLVDAKEVALWLGVSEAWVWDHSKRRAPFLPAIRLSNGVVRFRRVAIRIFVAERERLSPLHRKRRTHSVHTPATE